MLTTATDTHRTCSKCKRTLPLAEFHLCNYYCKVCKRQRAKADYQRKLEQHSALGTIVCVTCGQELPSDAYTPGQRACRAAANARYYGKRKAAPKAPKPAPQPVPAPVAPPPVYHYPVTRNASRIPVLYGCRMAGDHACYISDGIDTTAKHRHVVQAVNAWNAGEVEAV